MNDIVAGSGLPWTVEEFERAFPPLPGHKPNGKGTGTQGGGKSAGASVDDIDEADLPDDLLEWVRDGASAGDDRSKVFFYVVKGLRDLGYDADPVFELLAKHSDGIAQKYLDRKEHGSRARLRVEVRRVYDKPPKARAPRATAPPPSPPPPPPVPPVTPAPTSPAAQSSPSGQPLADAHAAFKKWLGEKYDMSVVDATASAAAAERLGGDPLWLMVISGSGNAKTETVQSLSGAGAYVTSTITSEGALLSATARSRGATGGLLHKLGARGLLVIKDFTSILAMDSNVRGTVLAALREVHDGKWERNVGFAGGRTLTWIGRLVVVTACTTAWDEARRVIEAMGDRFVVVRADSTTGRVELARQAIANTGRELVMRTELATAMGALVASADLSVRDLTDVESERLIKLANVVTWARSGVERDFRGSVINAHAPEMPTRFAKQLAQLVRGALALGVSEASAMQLATRCARDSIEPLRRDLLLDVAANPVTDPDDAHKRTDRPLTTVKNTLVALHVLGLLVCEEREEWRGRRTFTVSYYRLAPGLDRATLLSM